MLQAGGKFELLHANPLADDDMCMAPPAIASDRLLIRTLARLYCIHAGAAHAATKDGMAFSPDGKRLASCATVWDAGTGQGLLTSLTGGKTCQAY